MGVLSTCMLWHSHLNRWMLLIIAYIGLLRVLATELTTVFYIKIWVGLHCQWDKNNMFSCLSIKHFWINYLLIYHPSVNSPPNLPTSSPYCFYLLCCSFAHQYHYLHTTSSAHHHLLIYHSIVNLLNCNYFATMAYLLPYLLMPFAHNVYRLPFFPLCYWLYACLFHV